MSGFAWLRDLFSFQIDVKINIPFGSLAAPASTPPAIPSASFPLCLDENSIFLRKDVPAKQTVCFDLGGGVWEVYLSDVVADPSLFHCGINVYGVLARRGKVCSFVDLAGANGHKKRGMIWGARETRLIRVSCRRPCLWLAHEFAGSIRVVARRVCRLVDNAKTS